MKYEVWESDESGYDAYVKSFTDLFEAIDYISRRERYQPGYHFRIVISTT